MRVQAAGPYDAVLTVRIATDRPPDSTGLDRRYAALDQSRARYCFLHGPLPCVVRRGRTATSYSGLRVGAVNLARGGGTVRWSNDVLRLAG